MDTETEQLILLYLHEEYRRIALGIVDMGGTTTPPAIFRPDSLAYQDWVLLAQVDSLPDTDEGRARIHAAAVRRAHIHHRAPSFPLEGIDTGIGRLWWHAYRWCCATDTITQAEAARVLGISIKAVNYYLATRKLTVIPALSKGSRQGRRLLLRSEVLALKQEREGSGV